MTEKRIKKAHLLQIRNKNKKRYQVRVFQNGVLVFEVVFGSRAQVRKFQNIALKEGLQIKIKKVV